MFEFLFNRKKSTPDYELAEFDGMTIGRAVEIDRIALKLLPEDTLFDIPETTMMVIAQGYCDLGEQSHLHRFYTDDDRFLVQIQGGDGIADKRVDEIMLWYFWDVQYPSNDKIWNDIEASIHKPEFLLDVDGETKSYQRFWFADDPHDQDPMTYWETVVDDRHGAGKRKIFQTAMLFSRPLQNGENEMLLINMEEMESKERSVSYMIGRPLKPHEFSV